MSNVIIYFHNYPPCIVSIFIERKDFPMKKRLFALLTVMVLVLSLASVSLAAKPTATLYKSSQDQIVAPGKTIYFKFKLNSGSYTKVGDKFRAKLGLTVDFNSKQVGAASWVWTGTQKYKVQFQMKKNAPEGTYTLNYTTYCRGKKESASWKKVKANSVDFRVRK